MTSAGVNYWQSLQPTERVKAIHEIRGFRGKELRCGTEPNDLSICPLGAREP
jgi:hypothetical protein